MIGGNINATVLKKSNATKNSIGENIVTWEELKTLIGWLDLSSGDSKRITFNTKIQESTHIFICDYVDIDRNTENKKMVINNQEYDILLIDNPMELNQHLEIYLKYVGGQNEC